MALDRAMPEIPGRHLGFFVVDLDGAMIGMITLDQRAAERGHIRPKAGQAELGHMFLPQVWGGELSSSRPWRISRTSIGSHRSAGRLILKSKNSGRPSLSCEKS